MPLQIGEDGPEDEDEAEFERTIEIRQCGLRSSDYGKPEKGVARSSKRSSEAVNTSGSRHRSIPLAQTA